MNTKIVTILWVAAVIVLTAVFFINMFWNGPQRWEVSQAEAEYITQELRRRAADDCVLRPTTTGYSCREFKTGKIFYIPTSGK